MKLDESQKNFVDSDAKFVRLIAPAGSGKTYSLLRRCARVSNESPGDKFQIFTFTRAAKSELISRLQNDDSLVGAASAIRVNTLNAWGNRLVKSTIPKAKLISSQYDRKTALDNALQPVWMKYPSIKRALLDRRQIRAGNTIFECMEALKTLGFRHDQIGQDEIAKHAEWLIALQLGPQLQRLQEDLAEFGIVDESGEFVNEFLEEFIPFWAEATDALFSQGLYTFEDQKYKPLLWMSEEISRSRKLTGVARTQHFVVDEFQDINPLDLALISRLQELNDASLSIVGDDDQAIFEWRGASPEFILKPNEFFGFEFETHVLGTNYRSPRNIVNLSQVLISNNSRRVPKSVLPAQDSDADVSVIRYPSVASCVSATTDFVAGLLENPEVRSIALVSRKRSQILPYQITFSAQEIPFYAADDLNLGLSSAFTELKVLLAIRAQSSYTSPFGPGPVDLLLQMADKVRLYKLNKSDRASLLQYLKAEKPASLADAVRSLRLYTGSLKGDNSDAKTSKQFASAIQTLLEAETVTQALQAIGSGFAGLQRDWGKSQEDVYYTDPPFFYLAAMAEPYGVDFEKFYKDISAAMDRLARVPSEDSDDTVDVDQVESRLHLMTALRSKGREFDVVIVLDANDGIWPIKLAKTTAELEQERRLFYVATTRAKKVLRYTYSDSLFEIHENFGVESTTGFDEVSDSVDDPTLFESKDFVSMVRSRYLDEMGFASTRT